VLPSVLLSVLPKAPWMLMERVLVQCWQMAEPVGLKLQPKLLPQWEKALQLLPSLRVCCRCMLNLLEATNLLQ
jgi:hypothetical protein